MAALLLIAAPEGARATMTPPAMVGGAMAPYEGRDARWWRLYKTVEFHPQLARMRACLARRDACDDAALRVWRDDVLRAGDDPLRLARAVSARLSYVEDRTGRWLGPVEAYARGGDCEDHAVAKMASLLAVGVPETQLFIVVLRSRDPGRRDHAVLALAQAGGWRYLDMNNGGERSAAWIARRYRADIAFRADGRVFRAT
jgi:hypothetical protein